MRTIPLHRIPLEYFYEMSADEKRQIIFDVAERHGLRAAFDAFSHYIDRDTAMELIGDRFPVYIGEIGVGRLPADMLFRNTPEETAKRFIGFAHKAEEEYGTTPYTKAICEIDNLYSCGVFPVSNVPNISRVLIADNIKHIIPRIYIDVYAVGSALTPVYFATLVRLISVADPPEAIQLVQLCYKVYALAKRCSPLFKSQALVYEATKRFWHEDVIAAILTDENAALMLDEDAIVELCDNCAFAAIPSKARCKAAVMCSTLFPYLTEAERETARRAVLADKLKEAF